MALRSSGSMFPFPFLIAVHLEKTDDIYGVSPLLKVYLFMLDRTMK